jgi:thymidylate synthase
MNEFKFILGLHVLKLIFSNTNALASYLQGHDVDVMAAKITCDATIETLANCRNEDNFSLIWEKARKTSKDINELCEITPVNFQEAKRLKKPSKRLEALSGGTPEEPISLSEEQRNRIEVFYDAIDRVISEMKERFSSRDSNVLTSLAEVVMERRVLRPCPIFTMWTKIF